MNATLTTAPATTARLTAKVVARLLPKIGTPDTSGCWPWLGGRSKDGYGYFSIGYRTRCAHRVVLELWNGAPIPDGLQVDHRCRRRHCVNPGHLDLVSQQENLRRSRESRARAAA